MAGTRPASPPGVDSSLGDEASGPDASSAWSDLPIDLLLSIVQRLELPQALAFAAVCTSWCSAATAAGVPRSCRPWLMSWADFLEQRESLRPVKRIPTANCKFRHLLDVDKAYEVNFPNGCFIACCGASHGWLVLVNDLSNLVLFNPFTSDMVALPPITDLACVEAVYSSRGKLEHYLFKGTQVHDANSIGTWFYQKAVLSCSPCKSGHCIVMIIYCDSDRLAFVRAGENKWQEASSLHVSKPDHYADCAYHDGRFYTVTFDGKVDKWNLDGPNGPTKETIIDRRSCALVITRHLVSTPWGDLLQVRVTYDRMYPDNVRFIIRKVGHEGCKELSRQYLVKHAIFIGLNHSACLPAKDFPGLRPRVIYFSAPWLSRSICLVGRLSDWGGARAYNLKRRTFSCAFPFRGMRDHLSLIFPSEVWITPNL